MILQGTAGIYKYVLLLLSLVYRQMICAPVICVCLLLKVYSMPATGVSFCFGLLLLKLTVAIMTNSNNNYMPNFRNFIYSVPLLLAFVSSLVPHTSS